MIQLLLIPIQLSCRPTVISQSSVSKCRHVCRSNAGVKVCTPFYRKVMALSVYGSKGIPNGIPSTAPVTGRLTGPRGGSALWREQLPGRRPNAAPVSCSRDRVPCHYGARRVATDISSTNIYCSSVLKFLPFPPLSLPCGVDYV